MTHDGSADRRGQQGPQRGAILVHKPLHPHFIAHSVEVLQLMPLELQVFDLLPNPFMLIVNVPLRLGLNTVQEIHTPARFLNLELLALESRLNLALERTFEHFQLRGKFLLLLHQVVEQVLLPLAERQESLLSGRFLEIVAFL